jgi:predicted transcriptional regulator
MGKPKPIEQNMALQRIIQHLKERGQSFPEQIARDVGCNSRNILYYMDRYPELFSVQELGGNKRTYMKIVKLRPGSMTRQGMILAKVMQEID